MKITAKTTEQPKIEYRFGFSYETISNYTESRYYVHKSDAVKYARSQGYFWISTLEADTSTWFCTYYNPSFKALLKIGFVDRDAPESSSVPCLDCGIQIHPDNPSHVRCATCDHDSQLTSAITDVTPVIMETSAKTSSFDFEIDRICAEAGLGLMVVPYGTRIDANIVRI